MVAVSLISNMPDTLLYILQLIVFAVASLLHGLTGMGFPMIGTIALAMLFPLPKAIAIMAFPSLIMNFIVLFTNNTRGVLGEVAYYSKKYWLLALTSLIGSVIGIKLLLYVPAGMVYILMAVITLYYVINGYLSNKGIIKGLRIPTGAVSLMVFGSVAGIVGGATNAMSPILMMYLFSNTNSKHEIVKASNICYLLSKMVQVIMLRDQILAFSSKELITLAILTTASILFLFIGIKLRSRVSNAKFRNAIYLILLFLSIKVGYTGIEYFVS